MASTTDGAEVGKRKREQLKAYVSSREVFSCSQYSILVDSFRFVRPYYSLLQERQSSLQSTGSEQVGSLAESSNAVTPNVLFFLSHFHSDHYTGITSSWWHSRIFCSVPTAALVTSVLQVPADLVHPLTFDTWYVFCLTRKYSTTAVGRDEGRVLCMEEKVYDVLREEEERRDYDVYFKVLLLDANHCPGAAMFLFYSEAFGCILHTGDFRYNGSDEERTARHLFSGRSDFAPFYAPQRLLTEMAAIQTTTTDRKEMEASLREKLHAPFYEQFLDISLQPFRHKINVLFLDNTFCHPSFQFPKQGEVTQHVVGTLRQIFLDEGERKKHLAAAAGGEEVSGSLRVKVALIVGTYEIGKERVAFAVQEAFDVDGARRNHCERVPIYVSEKKMQLFKEMRFYEDRFRPVVMCSTVAPSEVYGSEAKLDTFPVKLPLLASEVLAAANMKAAGSSVSRSLTYDEASNDTPSASPLAVEETPIYELSILLVPMGSVKYPTLAEAVGRPLKRHRDGGITNNSQHDGQSASPLLSLDDGVGVDLSSYDRIFAVEPTGWSKKCKTSRIPPRVDILSIPYSEHSSFNELLQFVAYVNPSKVVPTVSVDQYAEQESLFVERAPRLRCRFGNTQPICNFFSAQGTKQPPAPSLSIVHGVKMEKETTKDDSGSGEERKTHTCVAQPPLSVVNKANAENKLPVPTRRPAEKKDTVAKTQLLTNYFKKAVTMQEANPCGMAQLKQASGMGVKKNADENDDDEDCLYIGCEHEVIEISDDDDGDD